MHDQCAKLAMAPLSSARVCIARAPLRLWLQGTGPRREVVSRGPTEMKRQRPGGRRQGPEAGGAGWRGAFDGGCAVCKDAELCPCFPGECPRVSSASQDIQGGQSASQVTPRPALKGKHGCLKADSVRVVRSGEEGPGGHVTSHHVKSSWGFSGFGQSASGSESWV